MKLSWCVAASLAFSGMASGLLCISQSLLGGQTLPADETFVLYARNIDGTSLPVAASQFPLPGGFYYPLSLGGAKKAKSDLPYFQFQGGKLYAYGGEIFSTNSTPLLTPVPLYISADSRQQAENFAYVNATCDGKQERLLRFTGITPLPLASASVNGTFAKGAALLSPILGNLPPALQSPVDLVITKYNPE